MNLSVEEVEHIAELARLELTDAEKNLYREQLSAILGYAAILQKIDTRGILPTSSIMAAESVLRPDEPKNGLSIAQALANAPAAENNQFRVPPVLD